MKECKERGIEQKPDQETPNWHPSELPGKRGFDTAHKVLGSKVESLVADYMSLEPKTFGFFDVVLYYGGALSHAGSVCSDETSGSLET